MRQSDIKNLNKEIKNTLNNAILLMAQKVGQKRLNDIGPDLGEYGQLLSKPLIEHVEDDELDILDNNSATLMLLVLALMFWCRENRTTKDVPALTVAAQLFKSKSGD